MSQLYFQVIWPRHGVAVLCCVGHVFEVLFKTATTFLEKNYLELVGDNYLKLHTRFGGNT